LDERDKNTCSPKIKTNDKIKISANESTFHQPDLR
jgi:hypothetical protein